MWITSGPLVPPAFSRFLKQEKLFKARYKNVGELWISQSRKSDPAGFCRFFSALALFLPFLGNSRGFAQGFHRWKNQPFGFSAFPKSALPDFPLCKDCRLMRVAEQRHGFFTSFQQAPGNRWKIGGEISARAPLFSDCRNLLQRAGR